MSEINIKAEKKFCSGMGINFFIFFLIYNGIQLLASVIIMCVAPTLIFDNYGLYMFLAMAPVYIVAVPLLWLMCKRREKQSLTRHKMGAGNYMIFLFMCFGVMIAGNIAGIIVNFVMGIIKGEPVINAVDVMMNNGSLWSNILIVGICAPIFEELVFRKFIIDRMVRYGEATAVIVSGLMFGLFHGNFAQFFYAAALGMLFAFVYVKTGRLRYSILTHLIINMSSSLMVPVMQMIDMDKLNQLTGSLEQVLSKSMSGADEASVLAGTMFGMADFIIPLAILLIYEVLLYGMALAGIILLIVRRKQFTFNPGIITIPKGNRAKVVWLNAGMILFSIVCLVVFIYSILV